MNTFVCQSVTSILDRFFKEIFDKFIMSTTKVKSAMNKASNKKSLTLAQSKSKQFSSSELGGGGGGDEFEEWKRARQLLKPPDQIQLSDLELKEEYARVLTCTNPLQPKGLIQFNYAQGCFLPVPPSGNTVVLLNMTGTTMHKETEEAKKQMAEQGIEAIMEEEEDEEEEKVEVELKDEGIEEGEEGEDEDEGEGEEGENEGEEKPEENKDEDEASGPSLTAPGAPKKKLTNQFNFCERAALTYNNPNRSQETQTIPPLKEEFEALVLQWIIYDAYAEDYAIQQREKEKEKKVLLPTKKVATRKKVGFDAADIYYAKVLSAWKTLERMVNLNTYDDIAKDYRYWEDPSDEYRDEEGTLLPLWKFSYEKTKKSMITDIKWNPWYYDLFVVSFGTLDYKLKCQGAVCMFTIKNPSYPENISLTDSGVMCLDIHPKYPFMVVAGLYNGAVYVYNVTTNTKEPQYKSNAVSNKHADMVWQVRWGPDLQDGEMNFYSVSADGKVNNWILMLNELSLTTVIVLYLERVLYPGPNGIYLQLKASATCMVFHPADPQIFLVGTEEGLIYKCSVLYHASYLFTYQAHHMPVYRINYNKFNQKIFASCSGDWRIKIWEDDRPEPLFVFDLGSSVGDVKWAPYSSTVFGAVAQDGKVYVFDLNINKYKAICKQNVVSKKKNKLTRMSFNQKLPIIIVGDERGCIHTLKLSPNLRIACKAPKKQQHLDQFTLQCMKLDKLLALVREPPTLTPPEDVETLPET